MNISNAATATNAVKGYFPFSFSSIADAKGGTKSNKQIDSKAKANSTNGTSDSTGTPPQINDNAIAVLPSPCNLRNMMDLTKLPDSPSDFLQVYLCYRCRQRCKKSCSRCLVEAA